MQHNSQNNVNNTYLRSHTFIPLTPAQSTTTTAVQQLLLMIRTIITLVHNYVSEQFTTHYNSEASKYNYFTMYIKLFLFY